jgi:putative ABC transport system permease protein
MSELFGIPIESLLAVLVATLVVTLAAVAALAARNRAFVRLGTRNAVRRRGRSVLIVAGLMLGTAIIAAALATGDTMSRTIRSSAIAALGQTDEVVAAKGLEAALAVGEGGSTGARYFPESYADRIARATESSGLVDGVAPVIVEDVAVQDVTSRQNEPRVTLFASRTEPMRAFGDITAGNEIVSLADLRTGELYLNAKAAKQLDARRGDTVRVLAGDSSAAFRVAEIVRYDGGGTADAGLLLPLASAQQLLGKPGQIRAVFVSNAGGVEQSGAVVELLGPTIAPLGLEADNTKQDALEEADTTGAAFMSMFTTFGSFSIAAGILLIFLIFVMLAAERRSELGIARAVGTRRGHLVQMFVYEGVAYDLVAAAVGALLGVVVAYGMVFVIARAFASEGDFTISYSVRPASVVIAYAIGMLLTLLVVGFSARRVSRMTIVSAIRNLPEPPARKVRKRHWVLGIVGIVAGALITVSGVTAEDAVALGLGVSLVILSLVPLLRLAGVDERAVHTGAGLALVTWFVLPIGDWLFGDLKVNMSIFVLGGLMIVVGATWTIVYNADLLLRALGGTLGRVKALAPVLRMAMAYPLRSLFRTGVTLAMFTLVVFTMVVGATTTGAFVKAFDDVDSFGGGFDVLASTSPAAPVTDMRDALSRAEGLDPRAFRVVSSISNLPVEARQIGGGADEASYVVHGADTAFLEHTTYALGAWARGYDSSAAVWRALRKRPNLAVVDQLVVPRRANWNLGVVPDFQMTGFYLEDRTFTPVPVSVRDPQTGKRTTLTVIGVLSDSAPMLMGGIWTSQASLAPIFGARVLPTTHLFAVQPTVDPSRAATQLESAFLANGMEADSLRDLLDEAVSASLTFDRLVMGFMALGLIVGVAALGVITARAVVERRQQIGVLRAIGFSRRMVQLSFLIESSFIALTAIAVGTALGLAVALGVIHDSQQQPGLENLSFVVPWATLGVIFLAVYAVAMLTTLAPARRASRIYPAEALRYE